jgi:hypothetical protein
MSRGDPIGFVMRCGDASGNRAESAAGPVHSTEAIADSDSQMKRRRFTERRAVPGSGRLAPIMSSLQSLIPEPGATQ